MSPPTILTISDRAVLLVQQMQRNPDVMPPYDDEGMRECVKGINELYQQSVQTFQSVVNGELSQGGQLVNMPRHEVLKFVKRCCAAYTNARLQRIKSYRWKYGGVLPTSIRNNLSEAEIEFFNEYCAALAEYQGSVGETGMDLMKNTHPPRSLFMQVRVLTNYGEFETSDGHLVMLKQNTIHSLPRQDCEMLIRQGVLERAS